MIQFAYGRETPLVRLFLSFNGCQISLSRFFIFLEWQIIDLACQAYGKVVAALYDSSSDDIARTFSRTVFQLFLYYQNTFFDRIRVCDIFLSSRASSLIYRVFHSTNHAEAPIMFLTLSHLPSVLRLYNKLKYLRSVVLMHSNEELAIYDVSISALDSK